MGASIKQILTTMDYGPAPESDSAAKEWLALHTGGFGHFINGAWQKPGDGGYMNTINPVTGKTLAKFAKGSAADVNRAVKAARAAQLGWAKLDGFARAKYLYAMARHLQKNPRLFSVLETLDNGKAIRETRDIDIPLAARHFSYHAGWAQLMDEEFPNHEAHGVVGQIIPWNFPLLMLAWKVAPALAAGNTVVLKPAEDTPLTALKFAELCEEIGLPPGVLNIVTGDGETGAHIVNHPGVDKIAFTGSTDVGRIIRAATAGTGKALTLELGGKSPMIVFDDADLDGAVEGVVDSIFFNQGEVCCAGSRLLVQESVKDIFIEKLTRRMENLRVGSPLDKSVDMGAMASKAQYDRVTAYIKKGVAEGATLIQPGAASCPKDGGYFIPPTVLTNVSTSSTVVQEEIFGPVLTVLSFRHDAEAVALANNTRYGLAASVWTENLARATEMAAQLRAGVVWTNSANKFDASAGFGGYNESGFGREGGREGMYAYLKPRHEKNLPLYPQASAAKKTTAKQEAVSGGVDQTAKLYIGGKQARPDGGYSLAVLSPAGKLLGHVGEGNRKDIRNAVKAADDAKGWAKASQHNRSQVMHFVAENLEKRKAEFTDRLRAMTGKSKPEAAKEVENAVRRLFYYAGRCDKYEGEVHTPPGNVIVPALKEPLGVMGIVCPDEDPLLGFISLVAPALATGNRVVVVPSEKHPLAATDLYQVFDTSDLPGGTVNIVTGRRKDLAAQLAGHNNVSALWYFGPERDLSALVEKESAGNLKQTWVSDGRRRDWSDDRQAQGAEYLRRATQVKNVWIPYGVQI